MYFKHTDSHHNNTGSKRESHMKNQSSSQVASPQVEVYSESFMQAQNTIMVTHTWYLNNAINFH